MNVDLVNVEHLRYLIEYCGAHRNCGVCILAKFCKDLETKTLEHMNHLEKAFIELSEEDILMTINLRYYCKDCKLCPPRCNRKTECENLMWMIIDDHRASKKPKTLAGDYDENR